MNRPQDTLLKVSLQSWPVHYEPPKLSFSFGTSFHSHAGVKRSKGNFTTDPFTELQLQLLFAPPGSSARIILAFVWLMF